mmetsp:Transcript_29916/g.64067  ORF Transcript_29916/g.64067 Transcript_29916/m.64067 type:complete len:98 (+) Transcript_29916:6-299(+)
MCSPQYYVYSTSTSISSIVAYILRYAAGHQSLIPTPLFCIGSVQNFYVMDEKKKDIGVVRSLPSHGKSALVASLRESLVYHRSRDDTLCSYKQEIVG